MLLSPAARRVILAILVAEPAASYDAIAERTGYHARTVYLVAAAAELRRGDDVDRQDDPTPEQIAERAAAIRLTWSEATRRNRTVTKQLPVELLVLRTREGLRGLEVRVRAG